MTVVAFRDGVMAADSMCVRNSGLRIQIRKLFGFDGGIMGLAGNEIDSQMFIRWWPLRGEQPDGPAYKTVGQRPDDAPDVNALVAYWDGTLEHWTEYGGVPIDVPFFAVGAGQMAAMAAMHMGASAERAVEVAIACDYRCGGDIDVVTLEKKDGVVGLR